MGIHRCGGCALCMAHLQDGYGYVECPEKKLYALSPSPVYAMKVVAGHGVI
jgi:hypothetical protein